MIKQVADNISLIIDDKATPEDIINFFVTLGNNYIEEKLKQDTENEIKYNTKMKGEMR